MKIKHMTLAVAGFAAAASAALLLPSLAQNGAVAAGGDGQVVASGERQTWDAFGGNQQSQKYSTATQITPDNAKNLKQAWSIHTGDVGSGTHYTTWGATPLFVNNTVYVGTPFYRIYAVEPDTGKTKWVYNSGALARPKTRA